MFTTICAVLRKQGQLIVKEQVSPVTMHCIALVPLQNFKILKCMKNRYITYTTYTFWITMWYIKPFLNAARMNYRENYLKTSLTANAGNSGENWSPHILLQNAKCGLCLF